MWFALEEDELSSLLIVLKKAEIPTAETLSLWLYDGYVCFDFWIIQVQTARM